MSCPPIPPPPYFAARGHCLWKHRTTQLMICDFSSRKREQYPSRLTIIGQDISRGFLAVARGFRCAHVRDGGTCVVDLLQQPVRVQLVPHIKQDTSPRYEAWNRASKRLAEPHLSKAGGDLWRRARTIMEISSRAEGGKGASGGGTRVHIYLPSGRRRIYAAIDSLGDFFILKWRRSYSLLSAKCSKDS
jgi:hypothetical protein